MASRHLITRLLSGHNRMSRDEKRDVLARVLRASRPKRQRRIALAFALAGAAAVAVIVPLALRDDTYTARGSGAPVAAFELRRSGDKVMFDLQPSAGYRYFAAFARSDDGTVIWLVPDSTDALVDGVLARGAILDRAGHYVIYGVFSNAPLSRAEIKARFQPGATSLGPDTAVATRELTIP